MLHVRKYRAPEGALRLVAISRRRGGGGVVRKHRAPNGALRLFPIVIDHAADEQSESTERQKVH